MKCAVILKSQVPPEVVIKTDRSILCDLLKSLDMNHAIIIECTDRANQKDIRTHILSLRGQFRKENLYIRYQVNEETLSPTRKRAYERSQSPGFFPIKACLFIWKEPYDA